MLVDTASNVKESKTFPVKIIIDSEYLVPSGV